jgi:hypothetical protein
MKRKFLFLVFLGFTSLLSAQKEKWVNLTDGKSFANWHCYNQEGKPISEKWKIVDGAFVFNPAAKSDYAVNDIVSDKEYENFELELEWKIAKGGNSGIFYGVKEDPSLRTPYLTGPEIQVLDDENHPDSKQGVNGNRKAGSLYDMIPSDSKAKPFGNWNKVKIMRKDNQVTVWLNDKMAVSYPTSGPKWDEMKTNSKFKDWKEFGIYSKGKIGLQDHGDEVWYRNIRIREL